MQLYKGYVPTKDKKCLMPFKNATADELLSFEQVKNLPEYAGILSDETILVDVDDGTTGKFTRQMTAASLSELLKNPDVVLIGVNRDPPVFYPYKRKKGR